MRCVLSTHGSVIPRARKATNMTATNELFLITGATGKTGAHTVRLLRERGLRVRALVHTL
jgi:nucleoside-diphosphate-sugar epimerase